MVLQLLARTGMAIVTTASEITSKQDFVWLIAFLAVLLSKGFRDENMAQRAALEKLWLWPLSPSYLTRSSRQGFILGFGGTSVEEMPRAVGKLQELLRVN